MSDDHCVHVRVQHGFDDHDLVRTALNHLLHAWNLPNRAMLAVSGEKQATATAVKMWTDQAMPVADSAAVRSDPDLVLVFMSPSDPATAVVTTREAVPHFIIRTPNDVARMSQALSSRIAA